MGAQVTEPLHPYCLDLTDMHCVIVWERAATDEANELCEMRDIFLCTPPIKTRHKNIKLAFFIFIFSDTGWEVKEISRKQRSWEVRRSWWMTSLKMRFPSATEASAVEMLLHYLPLPVEEVESGWFWREWAVKLALWTFWWLICAWLPFSDSLGTTTWKDEKRGAPTQERRDVFQYRFLCRIIIFA